MISNMDRTTSEQRWASVSVLATIGALSLAATTIFLTTLFKLHKPIIRVIEGSEANGKN